VNEQLSSIRLITFDVFGTLLDWRSYIESYFKAGYSDFAKLSETLQRQSDPIIPYSKLLMAVFQKLSNGDANESTVEKFVADFGKAPPFYDYLALREIQQTCQIGALSNCDYRHQFDAQNNLGIRWDFALLAEAAKSYKPTPTFWDKALELVTKKHGIPPSEWLHVSAYTGFDLDPAQERGILTCFVPRPGGSNATEAELLKPTLMVSDLYQLHEGLCAAKGLPIRYRVTVQAEHRKIIDEFLKWIRHEHGPELLKVPGCVEYRCYRTSPTVATCEYLFTSKTALEIYYKNHAATLRERTLEVFPAPIVEFKRDESELEISGQA
jgi:2-haloacid dehalogenase